MGQFCRWMVAGPRNRYEMTLSLKSHLVLMAKYNAWMNSKFIELLKEQDEVMLWQDKGAFFESILGTLVHIIVADLVWLRRVANDCNPEIVEILEKFPIPKSVDDRIFDNFKAYSNARLELDKNIIDFVDRLELDRLDKKLSYKNIAGVPAQKTFGLVLSHFFNHQTHHRGQVTTLLSQSGLDIGPTDLILLVE